MSDKSFYETHYTQFGWITVHCNAVFVTSLDFALSGADDVSCANDVSRETWRQINEYCAGTRQDFTLPLAPDTSPVLTEWLMVMRSIGYGKTMSYTGFAKLAKSPLASRAAGSACAKNPIPLIIPCHRVTRKDGSLGNYGAIRALSPVDDRNLAIKHALIKHEGKFGEAPI